MPKAAVLHLAVHQEDAADASRSKQGEAAGALASLLRTSDGAFADDGSYENILANRCPNKSAYRDNAHRQTGGLHRRHIAGYRIYYCTCGYDHRHTRDGVPVYISPPPNFASHRQGCH